MFEKLIIGNLKVVVALAGKVAAVSGYHGPWEFGVIATGLQGAISWELADHVRSDVHSVRRTTTHGRQQQLARRSNQRRLPWSAGW